VNLEATGPSWWNLDSLMHAVRDGMLFWLKNQFYDAKVSESVTALPTAIAESHN